jgi:pimeloyl-ACP methyl ester carboxylesterase
VSTVEVGGRVIHYVERGEPDAPPVLLLHGGGSSAATWERFSGALVAAGRRTIAPDLRGHGGSGRSAEYPLAGYRDDVAGLLDRLGIDRVSIVGHSLGAHTASLIAQEQPGRVTRLVLEEPPAPPRADGARPGMSMARFTVPALLLLTVRRGHDPRAVGSAVRQLRAPDPQWWERLKSITAPTLVISGGPSSHLSPDRLAEVAQTIPDARLATIPVGHRVHSRSPERFEALVVRYT